MDKWEYRILNNGAIVHELDELGQQGWELVAVTASGPMGYKTYYLKRRVE